MVALPRHFLVAFLIVLQIISPLVHAHIGNDGTQSGLHLQFLEVLAAKVNNATLSSAKPNFTVAMAIVEPGSAIKSSFSNDDSLQLALTLTTLKLPAVSAILHSLKPLTLDKPWPFPSIPAGHKSRAPPT